MAGGFRDTLAQLLRARFPILYVESYEEERVIAQIAAIAQDASLVRTPRTVWMWSCTTGLKQLDGMSNSSTKEPTEVLDAVIRLDQPNVVILRDFHSAYANQAKAESTRVIRQLRDIAAAFRVGAVPRCLILLSPVTQIPVELEKTMTIVDFPLPDETEIRSVLDGLLTANTASGRLRFDMAGRDREQLVKAALGLTLHEAENAFARAMVACGGLDHSGLAIVHEEKRQTVRKSGVLEFVDTRVELSDVGGLENLKRWFSRRNGSWLADAADYALPAPRGVLITGVPGCGKSLTAKAAASAWGLPLVRFDIGRVFSGLVGSSEQNMRTAIKTAEALAPCVMWVDEIEKGFAPRASGDSGTSVRVFGTFLTWMQEKTKAVFAIATANDISNLPPEFLRKGRFDEIFFVDLPTHTERVSIWRVHLTRFLSKPAVAGGLGLDNATLSELARLSEGYSGAEIEQAVVSALFEAFAERRPLYGEDLARALANMVPLSVTQSERLAEIRAWAEQRAIAATAAEDWDASHHTGYPSGHGAWSSSGGQGDPPKTLPGGRRISY